MIILLVCLTEFSTDRNFRPVSFRPSLVPSACHSLRSPSLARDGGPWLTLPGARSFSDRITIYSSKLLLILAFARSIVLRALTSGEIPNPSR